MKKSLLFSLVILFSIGFVLGQLNLPDPPASPLSSDGSEDMPPEGESNGLQDDNGGSSNNVDDDGLSGFDGTNVSVGAILWFLGALILILAIIIGSRFYVKKHAKKKVEVKKGTDVKKVKPVVKNEVKKGTEVRKKK